MCSDVLSDVMHLHADEYAVCGSRVMKMGCAVSQNGIGNGSNVQVLRRLRGGAGAYLDIPGQRECKVCHAMRCWPARKRCYRCDAPHVVLVLLLGAQGLDTFHHGTMEMVICSRCWS